VKRDCDDHDVDHSREDASGSEASYCSSNYKCLRIRCRAANSGLRRVSACEVEGSLLVQLTPTSKIPIAQRRMYLGE
jgi:hypothetical protein